MCFGIEWLTPIFGLLGVIVGGIITFLATLYFDKIKSTREINNLTMALKAEVKTILEITESRKYLESLKNHLNELHNNKTNDFFYFRANKDYFKIYNSNSDKIGVLEKELPLLVTKFYSLGNAILEDMDAIRNNEYKDKNHNEKIELYREIISLSEEFISTGKLITEN